MNRELIKSALENMDASKIEIAFNEAFGEQYSPDSWEACFLSRYDKRVNISNMRRTNIHRAVILGITIQEMAAIATAYDKEPNELYNLIQEFLELNRVQNDRRSPTVIHI